MREEFLMGNGAIALGLLEAGCQVMTSYPGTPSSEILPEVVRLKRTEALDVYVEWSTNEKVALDNAFAAAIAGKRAACCMKQVGLNVAADSLMSAAYLGTTGGLVIISCDDPGPHSSQTEQDSRLMARLAKVPVLDPSTPAEARAMAALAMELSETFKIPVILRPAIRVCHGRQNLSWPPIANRIHKASFEKNPARWAATPKFRYLLHGELNEKLAAIQERFDTLDAINSHNLEPDAHHQLGIIAGGVSFAVVRDLLAEQGRSDVPLLKIGAPYPFPERLAGTFLAACERVLVIEETDTLIEYLLRDRSKVLGRLTGHIPAAGELVPQVVETSVSRVLSELGLEPLTDRPMDREAAKLVGSLDLPVRKPTLCAGCPHRASFYAIRKARPKAIFTSDIGCYTLGINLGGVDTCLDMGAGITMASGFYHAFAQDGENQPIVATMGDSTFYHSGTAGLLNAVYNDARFILVILDNGTTAMTGMQPSVSTGIRADGTTGRPIPLERVVAGCGIDFIEVVDPYDLKTMNRTLKKAAQFIADPGGIAVIIARHPCLINDRDGAVPAFRAVTVTDDCDECGFCHDRFQCPALFSDARQGRTAVDPVLCTGCGVCLHVCPKGAIVESDDSYNG